MGAQRTVPVLRHGQDLRHPARYVSLFASRRSRMLPLCEQEPAPRSIALLVRTSGKRALWIAADACSASRIGDAAAAPHECFPARGGAEWASAMATQECSATSRWDERFAKKAAAPPA